MTIPESPSAHEKAAITSALYQPLLFGSRSATIRIEGAVLSIATRTDSWVALPALSRAVPETGIALPSVESSCSREQKATPESASAHRKVTMTFVLFQPAGFGLGETT